VAKRFAFRQQRESPLAPRVAFSFVAADEVALADHANGDAAIVEDRNRADMVFKEKLSDIPNRRIPGRRDNRAGHHFAGIHG
jgi:hypothetical protein